MTKNKGASSPQRPTKRFNPLRSEPGAVQPHVGDDHSTHKDASPSPYFLSPWNPAAGSSPSPLAKSPWAHVPPPDSAAATGLLGSLVREEGHVYSLAAAGDLLYTGSESRNIRVWKDGCEFAAFRSSSGFVKAIVIAGEKIFTGHQDGKIRVWRVSAGDPSVHKRVGSLPMLTDLLKSSVNPANYVEVRRHRIAVWIRHFDAVSCLSHDAEAGLLYSGSWDRTVKVWRVADLKCLESIKAHDDAINAVAAGFEGLLFTGSADGTVKAWRREEPERGGARKGPTRHVAVRTLLQGESAVTALAVAPAAGVVYAGSSDGSVNWWCARRRMVHGGVLRGHKKAVLCLAAAGNLVVSGSADKTLSVWRREEDGGRRGVAREHVRLTVLEGHGGPIKCVAVEEERERGPVAACGRDNARWIVYSGSLDRSVKVWRVSVPEFDMPERTPPHVVGDTASVPAGRRRRRSRLPLRGGPR